MWHPKKTWIKKMLYSIFLLIILANTNIVVLGFQRHGEDIGSIPLVVPVKDYIETLNQLVKLVDKNLKPGLGKLRMLAIEFNESSREETMESIINETIILREIVANNTPVKLSRYDFIKLALVLSIVDYYNGTFILDPLVFVKLVKAYNNARTLYLVEEIGKLDKKLSDLLKKYIEYMELNNTSKANEILSKIQRIVKSYVEKGRLDIISLVIEIVGQGLGEYITVDRIVFAEYVNNTSAMLKRSGYHELAVLLESIAEQLYRGYIGSAWNSMRLLQEAVLSLNITLTPELARKLAVILAVASMTYKQVSIKVSGVSSTSKIEFIASVLATGDINVRRKALELLLQENRSSSRKLGVTSIDLSSTLLQLTGLSQTNYNISLGILSPRSLLSMDRVEPETQAQLASPNPVVGFIVVFATSMLLLGVLALGVSEAMSGLRTRELVRNVYTPYVELKGGMRRVVEEYIKVLRILEDKGYGREWHETPREHLERLKDMPCYRYFKDVVEVYELVVYGNRRVDEPLIRKVVEASKKVAQLCG